MRRCAALSLELWSSQWFAMVVDSTWKHLAIAACSAKQISFCFHVASRNLWLVEKVFPQNIL